MEEDLPILPQEQQPQLVTLAEQRKMATPGDAESWLQSGDESDENPNDSDQSNSEKSGSPEKVESPKKEEEKVLQDISLEEKRERLEKSDIEVPEKESIEKEFKDYQKFTHNVDPKFAVLLLKMKNAKLINLTQIAGLKGKGRVHLYPKGGIVYVYAQSKEDGNAGIEKLSDFIDDLNLIRVEVTENFAKKLSKFKKVRDKLEEKKIFLFPTTDHKGNKEVQLGGTMKVSELKKVHSDLKGYRLFSFVLPKLQNRRSYKKILSIMFEFPMMQQKLMNFNKINMIQVQHYNREDKHIRCATNSFSKIDIGPYEYEDCVMKLIKKFFVVTFILSDEKYFEKISILGHPEIVFKVVKEKRAPICYLMIVSQTNTFFQFSEKIEAELQKLEKFIIGMRFFNWIEPSFRYFTFDNETHAVGKFPKARPYSMMVSARTKEGKTFSWKNAFEKIMETRQIYENLEDDEN